MLNIVAPEFIARKDAEGTTLTYEKFDGIGYDIYVTNLDPGDPFGLCYKLGGITINQNGTITNRLIDRFDTNPTKTVIPIDFNPTAAQQALIDAAIQAIIDAQNEPLGGGE